jgi:hypothetical protein
VYEQNDSHGGELLGEGSKPEIRMRVDFRFRTEIPNAVTAFEHRAAIFAHEYRQPGFVRLDKTDEHRIFDAARRFTSLAVKSLGTK